MKPLITSRTDWSFPLLHEIYPHIEEIAIGDLGLDVYDNQIEVISAEQMIDAYTSIGMPVHYNHWSFGKRFLKDWSRYQKGQMSLAYEIVINSNPCISYLMEENNAITQALVIAHAAFGHNFVFKNNYLFKEWTAAGSIIDYMIFAKNYIKDCEEKYGEDEVELVLDCAHSIALHGVDKRRRKHKKKLTEEEALREAATRAEEERRNLDIIIKTTSIDDSEKKPATDDLELVGDEENLLYFIYKNAPSLEQWKRELLRIVYKISQYFYPQRQDKVLNEGFATFTHFYIMNELEKKGIISPDAQLAWLHLHSNVIFQPTYRQGKSAMFNPYALGLAIFNEIRRVCEAPTKEDELWFPRLVGTEWREAVKHAATDYRDESFIEQFMTPKLIRDWRLFVVKAKEDNGVVAEISDDLGYKNIRQALARSYNLINYVPDIVVRAARLKKDRTLVLEYRPYENRPLYEDYAKKTLEHIKYLWGYNVQLVVVDGQTETVLFSA
jgi:stage V sporulation protein R